MDYYDDNNSSNNNNFESPVAVQNPNGGKIVGEGGNEGS